MSDVIRNTTHLHSHYFAFIISGARFLFLVVLIMVNMLSVQEEMEALQREHKTS